MTRCTLLLVTTGVSGRKALSEGMLLAERYVDALPMDLAIVESGSRWLTPGSCPPAPLEGNGATEWQWAHYHAVLQAPKDSVMVLWDVYVVPMSEQMAA